MFKTMFLFSKLMSFFLKPKPDQNNIQTLELGIYIIFDSSHNNNKNRTLNKLRIAILLKNKDSDIHLIYLP